MSVQWNDNWLADVTRAAKAGLDAAALTLQEKIKMNLNIRRTVRGQKTQAAPGQPPGNLTGNLSRSWQMEPAKLTGDTLTARVWSGQKYAAIHEYGGFIRAKKGFLPVPLNNAARLLLARNPRGLRASGVKFFTIKTRAGKLIMIQKITAPKAKPARGSGRRAKATASPFSDPKAARFVLKRIVHMPARPYIRPAINATASTRQAAFDAAFLRVYRSLG